MKVTIIAEISADIPVYPDDVINSDTLEEYREELDCCIGNDALSYLSHYLKAFEEIKIISTHPYEEGIDEYRNLLNNYQKEYDEQIKKYFE